MAGPLRIEYPESTFLRKAEQVLKCDTKSIVQAGRLSGADKEKRDLILYCIWRDGRLKNYQIGNFLGISYSAVSHTVKSVKGRLKKKQGLREKLDLIYLQFKGDPINRKEKKK